MADVARDVPKSLHTLTVLQQVAELHLEVVGDALGRSEAVNYAMATLGLSGRPDPHGLRDRAVALMRAAR